MWGWLTRRAARRVSIAPQAAKVSIRVLGPPAILDRHGNPAPKLRAKALELAVYLALNRSGAPVSLVMEALWPDVTLRRASQRLYTCVANLRHVIRTAADVDLDQSIQPVLNTGGGYRLNPLVVSVDWWDVTDGSALASSGDAATLNQPLVGGTDYYWIASHAAEVRLLQSKILDEVAGKAGLQLRELRRPTARCRNRSIW